MLPRESINRRSIVIRELLAQLEIIWSLSSVYRLLVCERYSSEFFWGFVHLERKQQAFLSRNEINLRKCHSVFKSHKNYWEKSLNLHIHESIERSWFEADLQKEITHSIQPQNCAALQRRKNGPMDWVLVYVEEFAVKYTVLNICDWPFKRSGLLSQNQCIFI